MDNEKFKRVCRDLKVDRDVHNRLGDEHNARAAGLALSLICEMRLELEVLRQYGNNDCTVMADAEYKKRLLQIRQGEGA